MFRSLILSTRLIACCLCPSLDTITASCFCARFQLLEFFRINIFFWKDHKFNDHFTICYVSILYKKDSWTCGNQNNMWVRSTYLTICTYSRFQLFRDSNDRRTFLHTSTFLERRSNSWIILTFSRIDVRDFWFVALFLGRRFIFNCPNFENIS